MDFEAVIGLEVHTQLLTKSKIFSSSGTEFGSEPNSQTDPVVLGMPGVLPVLNQQAVIFTIKMGLATNCEIASFSRFARKHYFYPDLPKGYQISQYELPLCSNGFVEIDTGEGVEKRIGLIRIHLEEDAGKSIHDPTIAGEDTLIDLNRSGVPLIEIVSEPDIRTPQEAYAFLTQIKQLVTYLEICDGNMEEGSLRCDANISIRPKNSNKLGVKTEVKNMNSFRNVEKALAYEIERQTDIIKNGGILKPETLLWDADAEEVKTMRSKEEAHDYRYFPEPDIMPIKISDEWINQIKETLPELSGEKKKRFIEKYKIPGYDAEILTGSKNLADYYEAVLKMDIDSKLASNWILSDVLRVLNEQKIDIRQFPIHASDFAELIGLISDGTISQKIAKTVFEDMLKSGDNPKSIVERRGLTQISDLAEIEKIIEKVIEENQKQVEEYKSGKEKVLGYLIGQVMREFKGKANPAIVNKILRMKLI